MSPVARGVALGVGLGLAGFAVLYKIALRAAIVEGAATRVRERVPQMAAQLPEGLRATVATAITPLAVVIAGSVRDSLDAELP